MWKHAGLSVKQNGFQNSSSFYSKGLFLFGEVNLGGQACSPGGL